MTSLMTRNPLLRGSLFDEFFRELSPGFFVKPLHGDELPSSIKIQVEENPSDYQITAELPGVKKEDISLEVQPKELTIQAQVVQQDSEEKQGKTIHSERYFGSVSRRINLPVAIDQTNTKAEYVDGLLVITLPKVSEAAGINRVTIS